MLLSRDLELEIDVSRGSNTKYVSDRKIRVSYSVFIVSTCFLFILHLFSHNMFLYMFHGFCSHLFCPGCRRQSLSQLNGLFAQSSMYVCVFLCKCFVFNWCIWSLCVCGFVNVLTRLFSVLRSHFSFEFFSLTVSFAFSFWIYPVCWVLSFFPAETCIAFLDYGMWICKWVLWTWDLFKLIQYGYFPLRLYFATSWWNTPIIIRRSALGK